MLVESDPEQAPPPSGTGKRGAYNTRAAVHGPRPATRLTRNLARAFRERLRRMVLLLRRLLTPLLAAPHRTLALRALTSMPPRKRSAAEVRQDTDGEKQGRKRRASAKDVGEGEGKGEKKAGRKAAGGVAQAASEVAAQAGTEQAAEVSLSAPPPGGSKMDTLAPPDVAKNMSIDDPLTLDSTPKPAGTTRIVSWNIVSLKSSMTKGFLRYIEAEQADVVFLTETKVSNAAAYCDSAPTDEAATQCNDVPLVPALSALYAHQTWGIGKTKGYAGVALLSKVEPVKVTVGIPDWDADTKVRE